MAGAGWQMCRFKSCYICKVGCCSLIQSCPAGHVTPWTAARQASHPSPTPRACSDSCPLSWTWMMPSNHLILCHPLLLLPPIFPSIRVFSNELVLRIRWPDYWSFSFSVSLSSEYSGLISFRVDSFNLLAVQGTAAPGDGQPTPKCQPFRSGASREQKLRELAMGADLTVWHKEAPQAHIVSEIMRTDIVKSVLGLETVFFLNTIPSPNFSKVYHE